MRRHLLAILLVIGACQPEYENATLPGGALELRDVGFAAPESVLHDSVADVYLVSNINGGGRDRDDNGFISQVSPEGELIELKWIDGADANVRLSAPKGSAIIGDSLFVTDLDTIRVFDRNTGAPIGAIGIPNAVALNDLAVDVMGALWVSDMGGTSETAARTGLQRIAGGAVPELIGSGVEIETPNGIAPLDSAVAVASNRGNTVHIANVKGIGGTIATVGGGRLDGVVALPDGSLLVSSWDAMAIFRVAPDGSTRVLLDNLQSPADIAYDTRRNRLLLPSFEGNWVRIYPLDE